MKEKSIFTNIVFGVLLFILVIAVGFVVWEYSKPYRQGMIDDYLLAARDLVDDGDSLAMWELEKAYFMGLDYSSYRQKRALQLVDLKDVGAESELNWLVDKGWANDRVYFELGKIAYLNDDYDLAWDYFGRMSKQSDPIWQGEALVYMAGMAGGEGNWDGVSDYLRQSKNKNYHSDLRDKLELSLNIVLADWDEIANVVDWNILGDEKNELKEKIMALQPLSGDAYFINTSLVLTDLDLTNWSRAYLSEVSYDTLAKKDLYLAYAYSYLAGDDCYLALEFSKKAEEIDSTDNDVHKMLSRAYQCLDLGEWEEWEEMKVKITN